MLILIKYGVGLLLFVVVVVVVVFIYLGILNISLNQPTTCILTHKEELSNLQSSDTNCYYVCLNS